MNVKPGDKQRGLDLFVGSPDRRTDKTVGAQRLFKKHIQWMCTGLKYVHCHVVLLFGLVTV